MALVTKYVMSACQCKGDNGGTVFVIRFIILWQVIAVTASGEYVYSSFTVRNSALNRKLYTTAKNFCY